MLNEEYTDESIMPWGEYKGKKLANVPGHYLLWCLDKGYAKGGLKKYIEENHDILSMEKRKQNQQKNNNKLPLSTKF